jgi:hypothetical protein
MATRSLARARGVRKAILADCRMIRRPIGGLKLRRGAGQYGGSMGPT